MDLTAAIRLKIDRLRAGKTARFNALSSAIEREVALLTNQSADLFTKLEDALEANVLGDNTGDEEMELDEELRKEEDEEENEEEEEEVDESLREQRISDKLAREVYDVIGDENKEVPYYYGHSREKSRTPSIMAAKPFPTTKQEDSTTVNSTVVIVKKPSDVPSSVGDLRSQAQATQAILAEKHASLVQLRAKHDLAMKRLDKLQSDLEKVSQKWEAEERARLQSESVSVLGKRKRDAEDAGEGERREKWKKWGLKSIEWGMVFGFGLVGGTVAMSQFQH